MTKQVFEAEILDAEKGMDAAFIKIPFDVEKVMGSKRPKVKAVFDGKAEYRGLLVRMQTPFHLLLLRKDVRAAIGKNVGDMIEVSVEADTEPREVEVPPALQQWLDKEPDIKEFFGKLSFTHRKEYVNYLNEAKREETRLKRLEKAVEMLRNKQKGV
jgi:hypothetical protein